MKGSCGPCFVPNKTGLCSTKIGVAMTTVGKYGNGLNFFLLAIPVKQPRAALAACMSALEVCEQSYERWLS